MQRWLKISMFIFLFALLWLPFFQEQTKWFKEPELKGAFIKPALPKFSIDSIKDLKFQKKFEDYENYNFGFRGFMVKARNSVNYFLFKELSIKDNIVGKDGLIFQTESTEQTLGLQYGAKKKYKATLDKIKFLKEGVEKHGAHFLAIIAPSKEKIYADFLPPPYLGKYKKPNEYTDFIEGYKKRGIPFIDFCPYFRKLRDTCKYSLFTKTSYHWSIYGAAFAQDSLLNYMKKHLPKPMPECKKIGIELSGTARETDADFEGPLNLFYGIGQSQYAYPKYQMISSTKKNYRPKVIIIGDSFFWQLKDQYMLQYIFSEDSRFWYYFAGSSYPLNNDTGMFFQKEADAVEELESADYVVLMCNISTLDYFPYGVADYYYDNFAKPKITERIANKILNDSNWVKKLISKNENKDPILNELVAEEAKNVWRKRKIFNWMADNNKYVCADKVHNNIVIANSNNKWDWETFSMLCFENNKVAIYSHEKHFLSTAINGKKEMMATRPEIGECELYTLINLPNGFIALKAANGKYLSLNPKSLHLLATGNSIGKQERFKFLLLGK